MMKKILGVLTILLLIGIIPGVIAQEVNEIDSNTLQEVKIFTTPHGAEVRMIQLEKSITRNILIGSKTIQVIKQNYQDTNTIDMETILNELEALLEEVKNYNTENKDANTLATDFVAIKKSAINLTQEFRLITNTILNTNDLTQIREEIKNIENNELKNMNNAIRNVIRKHNAQRTQTMLQIMGVENQNLIQAIFDGNITREEVKLEIRQNFQDLNAQEKIQTNAKIKETINKRIISEKEIVGQAKNKGVQKFLEMTTQRNQRLNNWLKNKTNDLNNFNYNQLINRLENISNRVEQNINTKQIANQAGRK